MMNAAAPQSPPAVTSSARGPGLTAVAGARTAAMRLAVALAAGRVKHAGLSYSSSSSENFNESSYVWILASPSKSLNTSLTFVFSTSQRIMQLFTNSVEDLLSSCWGLM